MQRKYHRFWNTSRRNQVKYVKLTEENPRDNIQKRVTKIIESEQKQQLYNTNNIATMRMENDSDNPNWQDRFMLLPSAEPQQQQKHEQQGWYRTDSFNTEDDEQQWDTLELPTSPVVEFVQPAPSTEISPLFCYTSSSPRHSPCEAIPEEREDEDEDHDAHEEDDGGSLSPSPIEPPTPSSSLRLLQSDAIRPNNVTAATSCVISSLPTNFDEKLMTPELMDKHDQVSYSAPAKRETLLSSLNIQNIEFDSYCNEKEEEILQCLEGDNDGNIDLWKLRELALTNGGLVSPYLRRRAWLVLTQCHVDVFERSRTKTLSSFSHSPPAVVLMNADNNETTLSSTKNVDSPSGNSVVGSEDIQIMMKEIKQLTRRNRSRIQFLRQKAMQDDKSQTSTATASLDEGGGSNSCDSSHCTDHDETFYHTTSTSFEHDENDNRENDVIHKKSKKRRMEGKIQQRTIYNIIANLLRQEPVSTSAKAKGVGGSTIHHPKQQQPSLSLSGGTSSRGGDETIGSTASSHIPCDISTGTTSTANSSVGSNDGHQKNNSYHYYPGLAELTSVLLMNLESPCLTTILICKLAESHLRDALRGVISVTPTSPTGPSSSKLHRKQSALESAVMLTFIPLLRKIDPSIYQELVVHACSEYHRDGLVSGIQTLATVVAKHFSSWFCMAVSGGGSSSNNDDIAFIIASRLADVFLVSHPLMPMYFAIAILSVRKQQFQLQQPEKFSNDMMFQWRSDEELIIQFDKIFQLNTLAAEDGKSSPRSLCEIVERVIAVAISYMKRIPPETLIAMSTSPNKSNKAATPHKSKQLAYTVRKITLLQDDNTPDWSTASGTSSELALIKQRWNTQDETVANSYHSTQQPVVLTPAMYPLSMVASGLVGSKRYFRAGLDRETMYNRDVPYSKDNFKSLRSTFDVPNSIIKNSSFRSWIPVKKKSVQFTTISVLMGWSKRRWSLTNILAIILFIMAAGSSLLANVKMSTMLTLINSEPSALFNNLDWPQFQWTAKVEIEEENVTGHPTNITTTGESEMLYPFGDTSPVSPVSSRPFSLTSIAQLPGARQASDVPSPGLPVVTREEEASKESNGSVESPKDSLAEWKPNPVHKMLLYMINVQTRWEEIVRTSGKSTLSLMKLHGWTKILAISIGIHALVEFWQIPMKNGDRWMDAAFTKTATVFCRPDIVRRSGKATLSLIKLHGWTKMMARSIGFQALVKLWQIPKKKWDNWMDAAFSKTIFRRRKH